MNRLEKLKKFLAEFPSHVLVCLTSYGFLFLFGYLLVAIALLELVKGGLVSIATGPIFLFLTSPFNPIEDFLKVYSSVSIGYFSNGVFVVVLLLLAQVYMAYLMEGVKGKITMKKVFLAGLIASYMTSAIYWFATGTPSTGSSVLGFGLIMFLSASWFLDSIYYMKARRLWRAYGFLVIAIFGVAMAYTYTDNLVHLIGGGLFIALLLFVDPRKARLK